MNFWTLHVGHGDSPIVDTEIPREIRILAGDRRSEVFRWQADADPPTLTIGSHTLVGDETRVYDWFNRNSVVHIVDLPYVTADLDALAHLSVVTDKATTGKHPEARSEERKKEETKEERKEEKKGAGSGAI